MTDDKITRFRDSRTYKCDNRFIEKIFFQRQSIIDSNETIWGFKTSGLPIYPRSSKSEAKVADSGTKRSLHSQTPHKLSFASQAACRLHWRIVKQYCYEGPKIIPKKKRAWLREIVKPRCSIVMIGWPILRFHKYTGYWCHRRDGLIRLFGD